MNVFDDAAEYLREKGWIKGSAGGRGGPACLAGAIRAVTHTEWTFFDIEPKFYTQLSEVVAEQYPEYAPYPAGRFENIVGFNDNSETTLEDVLLVLDKAGRRLDERV